MSPWRCSWSTSCFIVVLPFAVLLWSSFQKFYSVPSIEAIQRMTLEPYRTILEHPSLWRSVWNSLLLALGCATSSCW